MFDPKATNEKISALEAKVGALESFISEKVLPLIPLLQEKNAGQVAGEGATAAEGVIIPATELGAYSEAPKPEGESEQAPAPTLSDLTP